MKRKKMLSLFLLILLILGTFTACGKPSEDEIRSKMESHLLEKYGEPFVVENIGTRDANGQKFYTARIYPKTIVGTPKEDDEYYYATVNIDILSNGKLRKTGDTYGEVQIREETEKYLLPKVKEIFGERVRLKTEPILKEKDDKNGLYYEYIIPSLQGAKDKVKNNPEKYRLELMLSIYIFDKIDNEKEKEERKKQLFEFLQYLRAEKLDKYLTIDCNFMDDIVLAPSFEENRNILEGNSENRKDVIKTLREEVKKLSTEDFLKNMNVIKKMNIDYNNESISIFYRIGIMQILGLNYMKDIEPLRYSFILKKNTEKYKYQKFNDIDYDNPIDYIFYKENK